MSLCIRAVWSVFAGLSVVAQGSKRLLADSEDWSACADAQLIWVFAGRICSLVEKSMPQLLVQRLRSNWADTQLIRICVFSICLMSPFPLMRYIWWSCFSYFISDTLKNSVVCSKTVCLMPVIAWFDDSFKLINPLKLCNRFWLTL